MEPAAPGTEDEVQVSFPVYSKKANETDRLLSLKSYFPNGSFGNVFELSYVNGSEHWYCNMCECPVMGRVYHHEIGKRHSTNVANLSKRGVTTLVGQPVLHVAAGEPVPPGFEGEVQKTCQIQERLDNYSVSSLIGLEYLLEIQEYDRDKEPSYLCMLCDKRGDPRTVIAHLVSYNHISQYLQRHFVKCYQALSPYMTKQYKRNWQNTMNKIAEAIEQKHGRLKPHPVEKEGFEEKKPSYWAQIFHGPHFSEKDGTTFENLVNREEITKVYEVVGVSTPSTAAAAPATYIQKPSEDISKRSYRKTGTVPSASDQSIRKRSPSPPTVAKPSKKQKQPVLPGASKRNERRRSLSSVSSISSSDLSDYNAYENKRSTRRMSRSRSRSPYRRQYYERSPSPRNTRGKGVLPWQRSDYKSRSEVGSDRNKPNPDKVEEYKRLSVAIENDMEKTLKQHEKNPEKHPQYNEEWKIFWNKRYKELQAEGKDASSYDFKPEWIIFWNKRMVELHNTEVKAKKDALRRRLGLPDQPAPICFRITGKKKSKDEVASNKPVAPMASEPDQDHEVIVIEDKDEDTKSSKRSHSPWESEPTRPSSRLSREKSRERERSYERKSRDRERSYERSRDYKYRGSPVRIKRERSWDKWDREPVPYRDVYRKDIRDCYKPPPVMRDVTRQPVFTPPRQEYTEEEEEDTGEINIVGVLRLLTALEEKLGSLGPKVIDMLAQALAMEKNEANSSEQLLDNDVNCVLFETVKEKLKGQLLAGLVDYAQERAFKNAIKKIASLIHYANQRKNEKKREKPEVDPVKVPGIGTVDKAAIAKQIATALVLQGKTDVSQAELEQLINAVVGMAEASKSSGKPMTTASFIEQLNQSKLGKSSSSEATILPSVVTSQPSTACESSSSMEGLSDSDLQTLLQNFKDLSTEEQHGLITYLKKLEAKEPERVERLRKFVNLGPEKAEKDKRQTSPFSARLGGVNPTVDDPYADSQFVDDDKDDEEADGKKKSESKIDKEPSKIHIDSEEEEYTFDDVFQAANKKVKEKEMEKQKEKLLDSSKTETKINLMDAKALIANIMGNLNAKENSASKSVTTSSSSSFSQFENMVPSITTGNIVQAMDRISAENVKNLENIVGNLQGKLGNPKDVMRTDDSSKQFSNSFQTASSNFRTNFNPNLLNSEPVPAHSNQNIESLPSPLRNQMSTNAPSNLPNPMMYGQNIRPTAPVMNRNPMMQQNVQYPIKNIYGAYAQNPAFTNQANFNRPNAPGFTNQNFGYDNRYGFNNPGPRPGNNNNNNFGGNRW